MVAASGGNPYQPLYGVDGAPDQVERKKAFEKNHPEWKIIKDKDYDVWRAWRLLDGGEDNITRFYLWALLDELESRYPDEYGKDGKAKKSPA